MLPRPRSIIESATRPRSVPLALLLLMVAAALVALRRQGDLSVGAAPPVAWRVLIYMAADNDLDPAAAHSLEELQSAVISGSVRVAAQVDRSASHARKEVTAGGARRYRTTRGLFGAPRIEEVASLGAVDSGTVESLRDFLQWGTAAVPGEQTLLVLWGHGRGDRGLLLDESTGSFLRPSDLAKALDGFRADVLAMDVCAMQTLGVARELSTAAKYLVGSASARHALGWPYARLLGALEDAPAMSPRDVATWLAKHAGDRGEAYTGSALDLSRMPELALRVDAVLDAAGALSVEEKARLRAAVERLPVVAVGARSIDLDAALKLLEGPLPQASSDSRRALGRAVLVEVHSEEFADTTGLAVRRSQLLDALGVAPAARYAR